MQLRFLEGGLLAPVSVYHGPKVTEGNHTNDSCWASDEHGMLPEGGNSRMSTTNCQGNVCSYASPAKDPRPEQGFRRVFRVPVRIWGMTGSGAPFFQRAHTVDVGLLGVCIEGLAHELAAGDVLGLKYGDCRARFRVVWAGHRGTPDAGKVELCPLDTNHDFWGIHTTDATEQSEPADRRAKPRRMCKGSSSIRQSKTRFPLGASVTDISMSGCYVELMNTLPIGTKVTLTLRVVDLTVNCAAEVRTSHPGVGMGMEFEPMSTADRSALEKAIARLSSSA
jgi:hypothetical protein